MVGLLRWIGILVLLSGGLRAGVTARFIPDRVQPGDVFELRVEMDRAEYARFELRVPPQERLHRVAVETKPVAFEDGRYRQSETWLLQADRSGDLVVEGASVVLMTGGKEEVVDLPPLRLAVLSYAEADTSAEPAPLPGPVKQGDGFEVELILAIAVAILVLAGIVSGWAGLDRQPAPTPAEEVPVLLDFALTELKDGQLPTATLESLMDQRGAGWSRELREMVAEAVYAGRGDPVRLAELLEQEVAP